MDPATAFDLGGLVALVGWALLLVSLFVPAARRLALPAGRFIIPALISLAYPLLILGGFGETRGGGFGSIEQVRALFQSDSALAAGWLHYLAFDLFVGGWIAKNSIACGPLVLRLLAAPCLALTFIAGPAGFLLYLLVRLPFRTRQPLQEKP